jgi:hypothetical protein
VLGQILAAARSNETKQQMLKAGDLMKILRLETEEISAADDKSIAECMLVVIPAAKVGADVDRLVEHMRLTRS